MPICGPRSGTSPCPVSFRLCGLSAAAPPPRAGWAQPRSPHPPSARPQAARAQQPRRPSRPAPREGPGPRRHPGPRRARAGTSPAWCPAPRPAPCPLGSRVLTARRSRPGRRLPVHMAPALRARARGRGSPAPRFPQGAPAPRPRPGSPPAPAPRSRGCSGASPRRARPGRTWWARGAQAAHGVNESRAHEWRRA